VKLHWRLLGFCALAGASSAASAHSPVPGIGHFYSGMLHPLLVPAHLMAIVAMGLWIGQRWPGNGGALAAALLMVPVGMAAGGLTGWPHGELAVLCLTAAVCLAVAAARAMPVAVLATVGGVLGALLGIDSMPDGLRGQPLWLSLAGTWLAVLLGMALMINIAEVATRPWLKIGQRVLASWMGAAALIVLALTWLGPPAAKG
jgi:urease accessory protein